MWIVTATLLIGDLESQIVLICMMLIACGEEDPQVRLWRKNVLIKNPQICNICPSSPIDVTTHKHTSTCIIFLTAMV